MSAQRYADGLRELAEWVEANAGAFDADGVDLTDSIAHPVRNVATWAALAGDMEDVSVPASGYATVSRWFGPVELRLYTTLGVADLAAEVSA